MPTRGGVDVPPPSQSGAARPCASLYSAGDPGSFLSFKFRNNTNQRSCPPRMVSLEGERAADRVVTRPAHSTAIRVRSGDVRAPVVTSLSQGVERRPACIWSCTVEAENAVVRSPRIPLAPR